MMISSVEETSFFSVAAELLALLEAEDLVGQRCVLPLFRAGQLDATSRSWMPDTASYWVPRRCAMKALRARRSCCCLVLCFFSS